MSSAHAFKLERSKILSVGIELIPKDELSQTSHGFYVSPISLLKTLGKGEIAPNKQFSFSHSVFYPFGEHSAIFIKFKSVVFKLFQFGEKCTICRLGKGKGRVHVHPPFSRTFLVLFYKFQYREEFENNTTSDWLKCMV